MKITKKRKKCLGKILIFLEGGERYFIWNFILFSFLLQYSLRCEVRYIGRVFLSFSLMDVFTDAFSARKCRFSFIGRNKIIKLTLSFSIVNSVRCGQSHVRVQASIPEARFHKEDLELIYPYIWVWYTWKRIILLKRML